MNNTIRLIDEHFESQHSGKCDLLIQVNATYISYAIIDKGQDQLRVLCQTTLNGEDGNKLSVIEGIDQLLQTESHLKYHFRKIKISVETFKFTFIPSELYINSDLPDYTKFIQSISETDVLVTDIKSAQIKNVIAIPADLKNKLNSSFYEVYLFNQANSFIEGAKNLHNPSVHSQLFLNFSTEIFEAVLFQDSKLGFYNIFNYHNADEFNYFLLNMMQQLDVDKDKTLITLAGEIIESDEIYKRIEKYFSEITFADSKLLIHQSDLFKAIPSQLFFSLMSLNLCE